MEKEIPGFSNYTITKEGIIKTIRKMTKHGNYSATVKIKSQSLNKKGYFVTGLINNAGENKLMSVHRIMAITFIPNPDNHPIINHIDGNKQNNTIENLEWCTYSHNNQHAIDTGLSKKLTPGTGIDNHKSKAIEQIDENGKIIAVYESARIAAKAIGNKSQGNISAVCRGIRPIAYGFTWRYYSPE